MDGESVNDVLIYMRLVIDLRSQRLMRHPMLKWEFSSRRKRSVGVGLSVGRWVAAPAILATPSRHIDSV